MKLIPRVTASSHDCSCRVYWFFKSLCETFASLYYTSFVSASNIAVDRIHFLGYTIDLLLCKTYGCIFLLSGNSSVDCEKKLFLLLLFFSI